MKFSDITLKALILMFATVALIGCSAEISFTPSVEDETPSEEVEDEEVKTDDETDDENNGEEQEKKEDEGDDSGQTDVNNPDVYNDITPWTGIWASDAGMDAVGSDPDFYYEANTFSNLVVVTFNGNTATVESSNSSIKSDISGAYVTIDMLTNGVSGVEIIVLGNSRSGGYAS